MANRMTRFFWWCAGADTETLEQFPTDQSKYTTLGAIIFIVASLGVCSMFVAVSTIIRPERNAISNTYTLQTSTQTSVDSISLSHRDSANLKAVIDRNYAYSRPSYLPGNGDVTWSIFGFRLFIAILWGTLILLIDRLMVSTIKLDGDKWEKFTIALPRVLLALGIALTISQPIEIEIFYDDIQAKLADDDLKSLQREQDMLQAPDTLINTLIGTITIRKTSGSINDESYRSKSDSIQTLNAAFAKYDQTLKNFDAQKVEAKRTSENGQVRQYKSPNVFSYIPLREKLNSIERNKNKYIRDNFKKDDRPRLIRDTSIIGQNFRRKTNDLEGSLNENIQKDMRHKSIILDKIADSEAKRTVRRGGFVSNLEGLYSLTGIVNWAKWVIMLFFLILEILPIYSKLISKQGNYERALYKKGNQDMKLFEANLEARDEIFKAKLKVWKSREIAATVAENPATPSPNSHGAPTPPNTTDQSNSAQSKGNQTSPSDRSDSPLSSPNASLHENNRPPKANPSDKSDGATSPPPSSTTNAYVEDDPLPSSQNISNIYDQNNDF
jgi:hypothetical protein